MVIISDACRTPAQQIDTQSLTAVSAFPNEPAGGPPRRVDVFYASAPGQAALEVNTIDAQGIFTSVLHDALVGIVYPAGGAETNVFQKVADDDPQWYVFSGPLGEYLEVAVGERLIELDIDKDQAPTFDIQYGKKNLHWLARLTRDVPAGGIPGLRSLGFRVPEGDSMDIDLGDIDLADVDFGGVFADAVTPPAARSISQIADDLFGVILERPDEIDAELDRATGAGAANFAASIASLSTPLYYREPSRSVRVRGAGIVDVFSQTMDVQYDTSSVTLASRQSDSVTPLVVAFDNGTVAVIPLVAHHSTEVVIDGEQIAAMFFDPLELLDFRRMLHFVCCAP